jgi:hypothetical protein
MKCMVCLLSAIVLLAASRAYGQSAAPAPSDPQSQISAPAGTPIQPLPEKADTAKADTATPHAKSKGAGADVGHGAADIGKGVGKGAGDLAKGTGKGVVDLATLHPLNAAADIGKGAGEAGGHVAVGVAKGTGKIVEGTGKALKKLF